MKYNLAQPLPNTVPQRITNKIVWLNLFYKEFPLQNPLDLDNLSIEEIDELYHRNYIHIRYSYPDSELFKGIERTPKVPQEGREEVECTHPYKECVMSDRVNKNGTPLTRCSVCGNDNICDEEVMEEAIKNDDIHKEFTKEDMLAAFCAAEEYVDFYKWLEQYKPYQHIW